MLTPGHAQSTSKGWRSYEKTRGVLPYSLGEVAPLGSRKSYRLLDQILQTFWPYTRVSIFIPNPTADQFHKYLICLPCLFSLMQLYVEY